MYDTLDSNGTLRIATPTGSNDVVTITSDGVNITVGMTITNPIAGIDNSSWTSQLPLINVSTMQINTGDASDSVNISQLSGNVQIQLQMDGTVVGERSFDVLTLNGISGTVDERELPNDHRDDDQHHGIRRRGPAQPQSARRTMRYPLLLVGGDVQKHHRQRLGNDDTINVLSLDQLAPLTIKTATGGMISFTSSQPSRPMRFVRRFSSRAESAPTRDTSILPAAAWACCNRSPCTVMMAMIFCSLASAI